MHMERVIWISEPMDFWRVEDSFCLNIIFLIKLDNYGSCNNCVQILDELWWYIVSNLHYEHHFLGFQTRIFQNIYYCEGKGACKILVQNEGIDNTH